MNALPLQPPPVPCATCGGHLVKVSAFQLKCGSCGATVRRKLAPELKVVFIAAKVASVIVALVPSIIVLSSRLTLEQFLVLNAVCSLAGGLGLCARTVRWWFTLLVGTALGLGFFSVNLMVGIFVGCAGGFK